MHLMCITISIFACVDFTDPLNQFRYSIFSLLREHLSDFEFWPRIVKSPMTAPPWQDQSSLSPRCAPHTSSSRLHWRLVRFQLLRWSGLKLTGGCGVEEIFFKRGESTKAPARELLCASLHGWFQSVMHRLRFHCHAKYWAATQTTNEQTSNSRYWYTIRHNNPY